MARNALILAGEFLRLERLCEPAFEFARFLRRLQLVLACGFLDPILVSSTGPTSLSRTRTLTARLISSSRKEDERSDAVPQAEHLVPYVIWPSN